MKRLLKRISAVFTAAVITLAASVGYFCMSAAALDQDYTRGGVVAVLFYLKDIQRYALNVNDGSDYYKIDNVGDGAWTGGSGFFVGPSGSDPQYILTNHHVVSDYIAANEGESVLIHTYKMVSDTHELVLLASSCELRIYYSENDYDVAYIDCYGDRDKLDLAVLRLRNPTNKRHALKIAPVSDANVTDTVYTIGYPGNADNIYTGASKYGVSDSTIHKGSITRIVMNEGKGVERIAIDATVQHGNSGGPLVNENGDVFGVNTNVESKALYGGEQVEVDYYAISSNDIMRFLEKNNIPYEKAGSGSGNGNGGGSGEGGTPSADPSNPDASGDGSAAPASNGNSGDNTMLIIIIAASAAVVIVIGVVIAVVVSKSKKAPAVGGPAAGGPAMAAPPQPMMPQQPVQAQNYGQQNQPRAVIRSMSVQHNGKAFPVGKAPVVIGRNTGTCVIVYQEGTQGVSGTHCAVSFDSTTGVFTLTDLGSTYGTFLIGGQKLTPNVPVTLHPGDSFYAGDKQNVLRVELEK